MGDELDGGSEEHYFPARILFFFVAFVINVTLMNTFIAALGNGFSNASNRMEVLFQSHRAERVLTYMAIKQGISKVLHFRHKRPEKKLSSLWYCCTATSAADKSSAATAAAQSTAPRRI